MEDNRKNRRFMVVSKIECYQIAGDTINISKNGMQVETKIELPLNSPIPFYLFLPNNKMINIEGEVIWNESNIYGIEFKKISLYSRFLLYIALCKAKK